MKKNWICLALLLSAVTAGLPVPAADGAPSAAGEPTGIAAGEPAGEDRMLLDDAKVMIFDKKWGEALQKLDQFLAGKPSAALRDTANFYRARCLENLNRPSEALKTYEAFLTGGGNAALKEEAQVAVIDLAFKLYSSGAGAEYLRRLTAPMNSPVKSVQYYAAYKLSFVKDRKVAAEAVPVLKRMAQEQDSELRDRARIALLRVAPDSLQTVPVEKQAKVGSMLHILIREKGENAPVNISLPLAFADMALRSIGEDDLQDIKKQGFNMQDILNKISQGKVGVLFEISTADAHIKIWVD